MNTPCEPSTRAVDYLLKPYSDERFEVALTRAIRLVRSGASDALVAQMQALFDDLVEASRGDQSADSSRHYYVDRLALKNRGRVQLILQVGGRISRAVTIAIAQ